MVSNIAIQYLLNLVLIICLHTIKYSKWLNNFVWQMKGTLTGWLCFMAYQPL